MDLIKCKACEYTSDIHRIAIETEVQRLMNMKSLQICGDEELCSRLMICSDCKHLDINNVCMMCGCYVRIRTLQKTNRCPINLWK